jgi:hypothetical protein
MEQEQEVSADEIKDLKMVRVQIEALPIIVVLFTPVAVAYANYFIPTFGFFFFFVRIEVMAEVGGLLISLVFIDFYTLLLVSIPALIVSIVASWMLHRLSNRRTTSDRVLRIMLVATIVWAIYFSVFIIGALSVSALVLGPFPVPFGPIAAVLSRGYIMRFTEQIDAHER